MRYLKLGEVLHLHSRIIEQSGGARGILDVGLLESALGQCRISFGGQEIYPSVGEKAAALCFSIIRSHPFVDGNKRTGHAAMEVFLVLNGYELDVGVDEAEMTLLHLASRELERDQFTIWVQAHLKSLR